MASKLKKIFADISLEWGINKCAAIHMKQGKLVTNDNSSKMPVSKNCSIPVIGNEDHYKFLGKYQNTRHLEDKVIEEVPRSTRIDSGQFGLLHCQYQTKFVPLMFMPYLSYSTICGPPTGVSVTSKNLTDKRGKLSMTVMESTSMNQHHCSIYG